MDVADGALILSFAAIGISLVAVLYTRREANATRDMRDNDAARRTAERAPAVSLRLKESDKHKVVMVIQLDAPTDQDSISVALIGGGPLTGLDSSEDGPMALGGERIIVGSRVSPYEGGTVTVVITCRSGPDSWDLVHRIDVPPAASRAQVGRIR